MIFAETNGPWLVVLAATLITIIALITLTTLCILSEQKAKKRRDVTRQRDRQFDDWLRNDIDLHGGNE